jgi:sulfate transport system substrate-binding protein
MALRKISWINLAAIACVVLAAILIVQRNVQDRAAVQLLNVSYDPTRELYHDLNPLFTAQVEKNTGQRIEVGQSHGGSSRQARLAVTGELEPDVVTLGLPSDVDLLRKGGLIESAWAARLPHQSQPYTSTIVFVVRHGNPRAIHDWPDLVKPGVEIITPDPKSSGNGKLTALAAWGAVVTRGGSENQARKFLQNLYEHAPFLVMAAREAGTAFAIEKIGDVHIAWENEALREVAEAHGDLQVVYPPVSILAEPSVAWVDRNVAKHGTAAMAKAYLEFLFTDAAQELIAKDGYRPSNPVVLARHAVQLPAIQLFSVTAIADSWDDAQSKFFGDGGIIDSVVRPKPR